MGINGDVPHKTRVLVIGAGPVGLEVAAALKAADVDYLHVDAGPIGHTLTWWAPQTRWFSSNDRISICGIPLVTVDGGKATREDYLAYLRQVTRALGLAVRTHEKVEKLERLDGRFVAHLRRTDADVSYAIEAEAVVLAVGGTDYPRTLGIPGEDLPHVDGYLREPHTYFGRRVVIVGGKNSAVEAALRLHHAGAEVVLSYRGAGLPEKSIKYWLLPEITGLIRTGGIRAHFNTAPVRITPLHVRLRDLEEAGEVDVPADAVLKLIGYEQDKTLFRQLGVTLDGPEQAPRFDVETMRTDVPGVYVAGTAVGGTQRSFTVFLENCHDHGGRIVAHLTGTSPSVPALRPALVEAMPES